MIRICFEEEANTWIGYEAGSLSWVTSRFRARVAGLMILSSTKMKKTRSGRLGWEGWRGHSRGSYVVLEKPVDIQVEMLNRQLAYAFVVFF